MSVKQAVEVAEKARQAPAKLTPAQQVRRTLELQGEAFSQVLPAGIDADRWGRLVLTAVKGAPQLMEAFATDQGQTSVLLAAMQCATVGLEPNTALQEAWILPRKNRGVMEGQLTIGYRGLLKLARQSGEIETVFAQVVREGDKFTFARGLDRDHLEHIPGDADDSDDSNITHAYAIVRYRDGGRDFEVMSVNQINKHREQSDSWRYENARQYSPWAKWYADMATKTVLKKLSKRMPMSTQAAMAAASDEATLSMNTDDGVIDVSFDNQPAGELAAPAGVTADGEITRPDPDPEPVDEAVSEPFEVDGPAPDPDGDSDQLPLDTTGGANRSQLTRLTALLRGAGIEGDDRIGWANQALAHVDIDHTIAVWSSSDITYEHAEILLSAFESDDT